MMKMASNILWLSPTHFVSNIRHQHRCNHFWHYTFDTAPNEKNRPGLMVLLVLNLNFMLLYIKLSQFQLSRLWNIEYVKHRMLAFLSEPSFLKFRLSKSFSLLFQKSDSFQIRNPQKVKFKKLEKTHPQLQKLLLFTFCLMRLTPFRYDFNRERFLSLGGARASLETDPYFYPLSTKGF